ncbi:Bacterial transcriptional activator domain protein [compost metagenome]
MLYDVPFDEEAHEILLRAYIGLQDRTAFLLHYERMKANFIEELGVEPPATLKQLYINMRLY